MRNLFIIGTVVFGLFLTAWSASVITQNGESESISITCTELEEHASDLQGKEITIKAICWGSSSRLDGDVSVNLGDNKLEGMQQTRVVVNFSTDNAEVAKAIEKDVEVTLKATVGEVNYGAVQLNNPEIVK